MTEAARTCPDWANAIENGVLRKAMRPFDTVGDTYRDPGLGARRASRLHSIEELPVALGFLLIGRNDFRDAVFGAVNYGRDSDSIATMVGALMGALNGLSAVPSELIHQVSTASRIDPHERASRLVDVALEIRSRDREKAAAVAHSFAQLTN